MSLKPLSIGNLFAKVPIIQGGMGIGVSLSSLAGAVASQGGVGVISIAHAGYKDPDFENNAMKANMEAIGRHISLAKEKAKDGFVGVNIMSAVKHYEEYVKCCVENKVDIIFSGAGFPISLPSVAKNSQSKIAPIVSSVKATSILLKMWDKRYGVTADAIVVEGPKAGGHLGFKPEELESEMDFDKEVIGIIEFIKTYEDKYNKHIPVIFGGGVFDRADVQRYIDMGCDAVQVASRFVTTDECDAHVNFKQAYIKAKKEDIGIVKSPVGLPGRAIINDFVRKTNLQREHITKCFDCLIPCNPAETPYCISNALLRAVKGDVDTGLVFCGENAYRINSMTTVEALMKELSQ